MKYLIFEHKGMLVFSDDERSFFQIVFKGKEFLFEDGNERHLKVKNGLLALTAQIDKSRSSEKLCELLNKNYPSKVFNVIKAFLQ